MFILGAAVAVLVANINVTERPNLKVHMLDSDTYVPVPLPPLKWQGLSEVSAKVTFLRDANLGCPGEGVIACTYYQRTPNEIVMPNPCQYPEDDYARVLCHELGHVRGWPGNHPAN